MKKLLSLPPNLVECFHEIKGVEREEFFCTSDPIGAKLGSGGGTAWLLQACRDEWAPQHDFEAWLAQDKRILLHAGGQSRRLPAYAPSGKVLTPIPVFRWERGQRLGQDLLTLQLPLYERIMQQAPDSLHTLIASGDVYIRAGKLQEIPEADVVCYGLWVEPDLAKNHGVFVSSRRTPDKLDYMLQKPSVETLGQLMQSHLFLMDIGIWLLSDRAVALLMQRSRQADGSIGYYDLYSDFGCSLGEHPRLHDDELRSLSVAILPLQDGEFYHYGTSREMISSTVAVQGLVNDQRAIMHLDVKPNQSLFVQNAHKEIALTAENTAIWIENSWVGKHWRLSSRNVVTGVPRNDWAVELSEGTCIDVVPMREEAYVLRPYGFNDAFRGALADEHTMYLGAPMPRWLAERGLSADAIELAQDMQSARLFPVATSVEDLGVMFRWMTSEPECAEGRALWLAAPKMSADEISAYANLRRLHRQRLEFRSRNWLELAVNHRQSVFYQLNLADAASEFAALNIDMPAPLGEGASLMKQVRDNMFRAQLCKLRGQAYEAYEQKAFSLLREGLTASASAKRQAPRLDVYADQIVWGRSPVRIDLAGGWTDTPPYCLIKGGNVVNLAIDLNGQPPLQTYVRPCKEYKVVLRSIDLGVMEEVHTFAELKDFAKVGSPFSIPKAALALAGFLPDFSVHNYASLEQQLKDFGCGIEVTLLSAIPAGSGLGTSSILAATVLGALSDFCGLAWDKTEICNRTLVLEQLLTTGGGWQDQYGGVIQGIKLLSTGKGFDQTPVVRTLSEHLYTDPEYASCHLLYYTGITRTAKQILGEIVRGMFLYSTEHLALLDEMKEHADEMYETLQLLHFEELGRQIRKTWEQNRRLDPGTNPESVERITRLIDDYCLGYKLPGAGGGGYLYMVAKDPAAAARIKAVLQANRPNGCARFVNMSISRSGLQVSRS